MRLESPEITSSHLVGGFGRRPAGTGLLVDVAAGLLVGSISVVLSISLAALIFAGDLSPHLAIGITLSLLSATVIGAVVALTSSHPGTIALPHDRTAPILALMAADISARMPDGRQQIEHEGFPRDDGAAWTFADLDRGVDWCQDEILRAEPLSSSDHAASEPTRPGEAAPQMVEATGKGVNPSIRSALFFTTAVRSLVQR